MTSTLHNFLDLVRRTRLHFRGIEFHLDAISASTFAGWARNTRHRQHRPLIEIRAGNSVIGHTLAQDFRDDLMTANIGDGCYGFVVTPTVPLNLAEATSVDLYVDGIKTNSRKHVIKPAFNPAFEEFSEHMERRLDAMLALHKERSDREISEIRKQLSS